MLRLWENPVELGTYRVRKPLLAIMLGTHGHVVLTVPVNSEVTVLGPTLQIAPLIRVAWGKQDLVMFTSDLDQNAEYPSGQPARHNWSLSEVAASKDGNNPFDRFSQRAFDRLTNRQVQILTLVADGLSAKEIAARLGISAKTVEFHKASLCARLNLHSTAELIRYAIRSGLIEP